MRFAIVLDGLSYAMQTQYRTAPEAGWILDILDGETGEPIAMGIALVPGLDLMEQYKYIFPGQLWVSADGANPRDQAAPTYDSLGTTHHLFYGTASDDPDDFIRTDPPIIWGVE